jgi:hypothetical protein
VLRFCTHKQRRWQEIADKVDGFWAGWIGGPQGKYSLPAEPDPQILAGRKAFAIERSQVEEGLQLKYLSAWYPALKVAKDTELLPDFVLPDNPNPPAPTSDPS